MILAIFLLFIGEAALSLSSPPYGEGVIRKRSGELESPRLSEKGLTDQAYGLTQGDHPFDGYGDDPFQLGNMAMAERDLQASLIVSSPPYIDSVNAKGNSIDYEKAGRPDRLKESAKRISPMDDW